jgi:phosphoglycolate phosphatase
MTRRTGTGGATAPVLFDLDGTLADTFIDMLPALDGALAACGLPAADASAVRARVSAGSRAMVTCALAGERLDDAAMEGLIEDFLARYAATSVQHTRLFAGMPELLDALQRQGRPLAVVTNKRARFTDPIIDALGLRAQLGAVVSGDSAPRAKPHPDPLLLALDRLDQPPRGAVYVGDARNDVLAARAAGMHAVAVRYGYLAPGDDPARWGADTVIAAPLQLLDWLARQD